MQYATLLATAALATTALAAPAPAQAATDAKVKVFKIQAVPRDATRTEFSQYLSGFHVGAGQSTLVGTKDINNAASFVINSTVGNQLAIYEGRTDIPNAALTLLPQRPALSDAPAGYDYISGDLGYQGTKGFVIAPPGEVVYEGDLYAHGPQVKSFALCHVNGTSPYLSLGPQYQLLWEPAGTKPSNAKCADVGLKVV